MISFARPAFPALFRHLPAMDREDLDGDNWWRGDPSLFVKGLSQNDAVARPSRELWRCLKETFLRGGGGLRCTEWVYMDIHDPKMGVKMII